MTATEKADALIFKFQIFLNYDQKSNLVNHDPSSESKNKEYHLRVKKDAKELSKIAVNEILNSWEIDGNKRLDKGIINYWNQVLKEIDKI